MNPDKLVNDVATWLNAAMNRCHRELAPATPEIISRLCAAFQIDAGADAVMLHAVRNALDEFVEEQYSQCLDINTPADPQSFIDVIKKEQTGVPSIGERDSVIMCAECTERSAHVECVQCQDVFCAACHGTTHMTGKRQYHEKVSVHQTVCHLCDRSLGTSQVLFGTGDARIFCDGCYGDEMLLNIAIRTLPKKYLSGLRCFECHTADATTICEDCSDLFCHRCFHKIHRRGRMARHVQLWIDEKGSIWRGGVCLRPEDVQAVIDKARKNSSRASWMLFQDDRLCSYWYNFLDRTTSTTLPVT